jgi:hypothetical protein
MADIISPLGATQIMAAFSTNIIIRWIDNDLHKCKWAILAHSALLK